MRPIDADALDVLTIISGRMNGKVEFAKTVNEMIQNAPTIDAVPVIRCKDCKYFERYSKDHPAGWCHAAQHGYMSSTWDISIYRCTRENEFCSQAERREENVS